LILQLSRWTTHVQGYVLNNLLNVSQFSMALEGEVIKHVQL
jgi:hypothetical protein